MTRALPQVSQDDSTETCKGNKNVLYKEENSSDRLCDAFMSVQDTLTVSQANAFYDFLFRETDKLKSVFTIYSGKKCLLYSKSDEKQSELISHSFGHTVLTKKISYQFWNDLHVVSTSRCTAIETEN